ncbi:MAG: PTS sugar transporter subunit IIA [Proteobacteria bacterium]|nr:PTS sugar transporter subunit IIA [Pseudomonadota bacterium]
MRIEDILRESCVVSNIKSKGKKEALFELVSVLKEANLIKDVEKVVDIVLEREKLGSTGIGDGVAIPHGKMKGINNILCVFGKSKNGVDFDAVDRKPVRIFFLLLAPEDSANLHLKTLSRISKLLRDPSFKKKLMDLNDSHEIYSSIIEEDRKI